MTHGDLNAKVLKDFDSHRIMRWYFKEDAVSGDAALVLCKAVCPTLKLK